MKDIKELDEEIEMEHHHHHHDDDEECDCHEHEHHHHHHHDDDEECDCHEHEHHHHHDDDEECDCHEHEHHHHHHHDHGTKYEVEGFNLVETHSHEGATICSFEKEVSRPKDEVNKDMEECIKALEKWLDETDAMIGHVKGYVKEAGITTTFSTVGFGLNIENHEGTAVNVGFASIVFGPSEVALKDKVVELFSKI